MSRIGSGLCCAVFVFFGVELKSKGYGILLQQIAPPWGRTMAIRAPLAMIGLLSGVPTERGIRVQVGYGSPNITLHVSYGPTNATVDCVFSLPNRGDSNVFSMAM